MQLVVLCWWSIRINPAIVIDRIDFVTIAQTGNAQDFGDLTLGQKTNGHSCCNV